MNVIFVRHLGKKKNYAFEVPVELAPYVAKGNTVVCDTAKGENLGITTSGLLYGPGVEDVAIMHGATLPLARITGVWSEIPMRSIRLPRRFTGNLPRAEKLQTRMDEYKASGSFRTNIIVDEDGYLQDGYSAYCIAKILNLEKLPVFVGVKKVSTVEKKEETANFTVQTVTSGRLTDTETGAVVLDMTPSLTTTDTDTVTIAAGAAL